MRIGKGYVLSVMGGVYEARARLFAGVAMMSVAAMGIELALGLSAGLSRQGSVMVGEWEGNLFVASRTSQSEAGRGRKIERNSISWSDVVALRGDLGPQAKVVAMSTAYNVSVRANGGEGATQVTAAEPGYLWMQGWNISSGRRLSEVDEHEKAMCCLIGQTIARELFGLSNPVGKRLHLLNSILSVAGVLAPKGRDSHGEDRDSLVLVPYTTGTKRLWSSQGVRGVLVKPTPDFSQQVTAERIAAVLRERHRIGLGERQDFSILWDGEILQRYRGLYRTKLLVGWILAAVAVAAAGIMTAVTSRLATAQRRREFALKRSIGARRGRIVVEVLGEVATLVVVGLFIGSLAATIVSSLVSRHSRLPGTEWSNLPIDLTPAAIGVAGLTLALCSGVAALGPARSAGNTEPATALRA